MSFPRQEGSPRYELRISGDAAGTRLDRALGALSPEGLRGRRRRITGGGVLVNGRPCRDTARRLRAGDLLSLAPPEAEPPAPQQACLLARRGDFCFFFKGAGLHSAALAGNDGDSLEERLPLLCAPVLTPGEMPVLLQRLDHGTSGIVCAGLTPEAVRAFRAAEAAGHCEKRYLALLLGALDGPVTTRQRLDTRQRRTTRLLDGDGDALRWTEFRPLHIWQEKAAARLCSLLETESGPAFGAAAPQALTLAACRIRRGARHQIRAHAAALGHPLLGDTRYDHLQGNPPSGSPLRFFLHHGCLVWPGGCCSALPPWPWLETSLPETALLLTRSWLCPDTPARELQR